MDEILKISEKAIIKYFTYLSQLGYKKDNDVNILIVILYIEELLSGELAYFITECDYNIIMRAIYNLTGNDCVIDFPIFKSNDTLFHSISKNLVIRSTENDIIRTTNDGTIRVKV